MTHFPLGHHGFPRNHGIAKGRAYPAPDTTEIQSLTEAHILDGIHPETAYRLAIEEVCGPDATQDTDPQ